MSTGRPHHYGHLLQVYKESLQPLTLDTSFHDLINVYSRRSGADNLRGQNFDANRNLLSLQSFATSFKKISLKSDFIHFLFMILYLYIHVAPGQGLTTPRGRNFYVNRNILSLWSFVASFKKISLKSDFMQFFSWFYTCMPRGRGKQSPGEVLMSTEMSCHFIHLMEVLKKCLWSLILYNLFYDLIHVYSPGAGADSPQGAKFGCQQKGIITLPICCKFQRNLFEVWFYTFFSWFNTCI